MESPVNNGSGQLFLMKDSSPLPQRFIGGKQNRSAFVVAMIDHLKEDIGSSRSVAEIAHFINYQDMRLEIGFEGNIGSVEGELGGANGMGQATFRPLDHRFCE
jgi:hypothetical protein